MSRSHWSDRAYIGFPFACSPDPVLAVRIAPPVTPEETTGPSVAPLPPRPLPRSRGGKQGQ